MLYREASVKKIALILLSCLLLTSALVAADSYRPGKILKWENSANPHSSKKGKTWVVYQLQADTTTYSIARQKENKPQMQAGEIVQYDLKKNHHINVVGADGKKREYQIVGQAAPAQ